MNLLVRQCFFKSDFQLASVLGLHHHNLIGPSDIIMIDGTPRIVAGATGAHIDLRMIFKDRFGSWATPLIATADKQNISYTV